jgi:hypothetical protein
MLQHSTSLHYEPVAEFAKNSDFPIQKILHLLLQSFG